MQEREIASMKDAYGMLYSIENALREYIREQMNKKYGQHWFHTAPRLVLKCGPRKDFESLNFYELESMYIRTYINAFPQLPSDFFHNLHNLYPLRNKIAHCHYLNEDELNTLYHSYNFVMLFINEKIGSGVIGKV